MKNFWAYNKKLCFLSWQFWFNEQRRPNQSLEGKSGLYSKQSNKKREPN